ncbi:hypothetical protein BaRGS_00008066 [Batillaria attramentaria]|uniref:PLAT domain-containing protein n=1 Tax=Batillaria attramentaria TaxID=370345 RepID=A0ABD0LML6_9CAEN
MECLGSGLTVPLTSPQFSFVERQIGIGLPRSPTQALCSVDGRVLVRSIQLLESIRKRAAEVYMGQTSFSSEIVSLAVQVVSNLIKASIHGPLLRTSSEDAEAARQRQTQRAVNVVNDLLTLSLYDHTLGESPVRHSADFISLAASHYHSHYQTSINISSTTFTPPLNMAPVLEASARVLTSSRKDERDCFQARVTAFQENPYAYREDQFGEIQSEVVSLDMFTCGGEHRLAVKDLEPDNNVQITIPLTTSVETGWEYQMERSRMNIHHFNMTPSQEDLYLTLLVNMSAIPAGQRPFPVTAVISKVSKVSGVSATHPVNTAVTTVSVNAGAGSYYLGLIETSLNSGRRRKTEVSVRNYTLSAWFGSCLFWSDTAKSWSNKGCQVANTATTEATHCRCSHLTAFGSHVELVPNDLSFTDVENFFSPHENPVMMILIGVVMLVYILLLMLARRADTHDMRKGGMVCLADNNVSDTQMYEVVIDTGLRQSTPTSAKISIILHGEYGMSETRELISDDDRPMFERSSRDRFLLTLPDSLGRILKVQMWHNNAGGSPRWFLGQVLVRDLNTGKANYFLCEKWFAVDEGDGRVEREVVAVDNISFAQVLLTKGREYLADFHLWTSVFTCPPHTRFTRAQRLTCCLTVLLLYMALNAMWFQRQPEQRRGEFGLLDLSWRSMAVGAICCAIVFPLNLFLTFLFRRSRVSHSPCDHKVDTSSRLVMTSNLPATHTSSGEGMGGGGTGSGGVDAADTLTTYSLLDQSILNWQSIQDWAQRQWVKRQQSTRSSANSVKNNAQPATQPCPTQPVQHTLHAGDETDQASSGFEDAVSQATAERNRIRAASDSSSEERRSHLGESDVGGRQIFLPAWCRYVAWVLCALISITSATVTILYGFRFGPVKSTFWLQSLYFSFMICVFLAQPIWILVTVVWVAILNRNNPAVLDHGDDEGEVRDAIEAWHIHQKQVLENSEEAAEIERGVRARQRSRYLRFARPPQEKSLQESRKKLMKEKNAANFLREVTVFVFMFTLVCIMAYGKDVSPHYQLNQSLDTLLLRGRLYDFHNIQNVTDWHGWAQTTLLDAVYGTWHKPGLLMENGEAQGNNLMVGYPFLRQLRVLQQPCQAMPYISHDAPCRYAYDDQSGYRDGSRQSWSGPPPGGSAVWGQHGSYDGGGFVVPLNYSSKAEAFSALKQLEEDMWVDRRTRAVILEITILNIPTSLFSAVQLLLELPSSGGAFPLPRITSTCLFRYVTAWDNCILACELLFILLALVQTQSELIAIVQQGRAYFTWPWNYMQVMMCLASLVYVACYIYRFVLVSETVEFLRSTFYEQFISLAFLAGWDELLRSLVGLLVFLVLMTQGLQLARYCPHLAKFTAVYRRARREIVLLMLMFLVIIAAYSSLGSALFASVSFSMRSVWSATLAVTALSTGIYSAPELLGDGMPWFDILALFFYIFGAGLLTAYSVAVLTHRLRVYKSSDVLVMGKCELLDYSVQRLLLLAGIRKLTPVHEPEIDLPPECTLAEFEYQVEELLFRMNALAGTTNLPEKPAGYLTDSDQSQANGDDGISSGGSEPQVERSGAMQVEGEGRLEQRVQKIEDKLYANEPYLAQLLKLDSIGADVLSQEKEKQLRSHLEMEIFRQLQMRRQETGDPVVAVDTSLSPAATTTTTTVTSAKPATTMTALQPQQQHLMANTMPDPSRHNKTQTAWKGHGSMAGRTEGPALDSVKARHRQGGNRDENADRNITRKQIPVLDPGPPPPAPYCSTSDESPGSETACLLSSGDDLECSKAATHKPSGVSKHGKGVAAVAGLTITTNPFDSGGGHLDGGHIQQRNVADADTQENQFSASKKRVADDVRRTDSFRGSGKHHVVDALAAAGMERTSSLRTSGRKNNLDVGIERSDSLRLPGKKLHADYGMERSDSLRVAGKKHPADSNLLGVERSDSLRQAGKKLLPDLAQSGMERSDSLRSAGKKPELPPKPTFAHSVLPSLESRRSPKPPPLKIPSERVLHRADVGAGAGSWAWRGDAGGSGQLGESSSGSEQDTVFTGSSGPAGGSSRRTQGQGRRNLRKTKSRGKGKGAGTLTPTLLLDELSFTVHEPPKDLLEPEDIVVE